MIAPGAYVRVTQDAIADEPLVEGMVGKVVPDIYGKAHPGAQAMVLMAGARKPCAVPLEAVEEISESDFREDRVESRGLWRMRKAIWRERSHAAHQKPPEPIESEAEEEAELKVSLDDGHHLDVADVLRRADAVDTSELAAIANPALISILTEWSVSALDVLADAVPRFKTMTYLRARKVRTDQIERWLWDGLRLYLAVRSYHPTLPPLEAEPARERVRALFERIDEGDPAERLAAFSLDVPAVKDALSQLSKRWLRRALASFAKGMKEDEPAFHDLAKYILQLHIVGFQVGFCADQIHHGIPSN